MNNLLQNVLLLASLTIGSTLQASETMSPPPCASSADPVVISASRCGDGTVTLSATPVTGATINWYSASTGGSVLAVTPTFTTPVLLTTTTFYAQQVEAGCDSSARVPVIATVNLIPSVIALASENVVCPGASVTLSGTGAVTYNWTGPISITDGVSFTSPIGTSTFVVTGTASNSCTDTASITISNFSSIADAGPNQAVCVGASVTLAGSNGSTYNWNGPVTITNNVSFIPPVGVHVFTMTGSDLNACIYSDQVTVTVNALPVVTAGSDINSCGLSSVSLTASGAATYSWNNGVLNGVAFAAPTTTTTYVVTGANLAGCSDTDTVIIVASTSVTAVATLLPSGIFSTPNTGTFQWLNCETFIPLAGATGSTFTPILNGEYAVIVTSPQGCKDTSACAAIGGVGLNEIEKGVEATISPNPSNGIFNVNLKSSDQYVLLTVFDVKGKIINLQKSKTSENLINIQSADAGIYFVKIETENASQTYRVVKN